MIRVRLQIADGEIKDAFDAYGFIYESSDTVYGAEINSFETTTYPGQSGENLYPKTTRKAFDYTAKFVVLAENSDLDNANKKIAAFNKSLSEPEEQGSDIEVFKQVTFYNDYKHHKIVGYPYPITTAKSLMIKNGVTYDYAEVEFKIRVNKPSLCEFE
jgi:V8-like Glu-specific endopeptidase